MNVGAMVLYRFSFAVLGLVPLLFSRRAVFARREWLLLSAASLLGIPIQFLMQFYGLSLTTVSHAALMVGTMPVFLAVGATLFANERLHAVGWASLAVSVSGAVLIVFGGRHQTTPNGPSFFGDMMVVASMAIALFWILINKQLIATHPPAVVSAWGTLLGWLMLVVCVPPFWGLPPLHGISAKAWAALAASGILCTAATTLLWNWGMTRVPASQAAVLLNMEPLMGTLLGVLIIHEHLGPLGFAGGCLILAAAVTLTTLAPQAAKDATEVAATGQP